MDSCGAGSQQVAHVLDEERLRLRVALLVARARRQHQQPLGARAADVEQVALAVEPVLADGRRRPLAARDRAAVLVGQERLGRRALRELALLQAAHEHGLEAARADRLGLGHLHAVGLGRLAEAHPQLAQHRQHALRAEPRARVGLHDARAARPSASRAATYTRGSSSSGPAQDRGPALGRARRTGARAGAPARPGRRRPPRAVAQAVEVVELPALALPQRARARRRCARPSRRTAPRAGRPGPAVAAGPGVRSHASRSSAVASAAVGAAHQRQQPAAEPGVPERHGAVDRERDVVGAEHLLEQRRVVARPAQHDGDVARLDARRAAARAGARRPARSRRAGRRPSGTRPPRRPRPRSASSSNRLRSTWCRRVREPRRRSGRRAGPGRARARRTPAAPGARSRRLERRAAGLEGERGDHVRAAAAGERVERVELERIEVVEAVDEHRRGAPAPGLAPQRVERAPGEQLRVGEPGGLEPVAVAAVDRGDLLGVARGAGPRRPRRAAPA